MHFSFINENLKVAENGGIADDRYITHPLEMAEGRKTYATYDIPINLNDIWNKYTGYHAFLTHRYNLGFYRDVTQENDTGYSHCICACNQFYPYSKNGYEPTKVYFLRQRTKPNLFPEQLSRK